MMDQLERERMEVFLFVLALYGFLLGVCGFIVWLFWS